MKSWRTWAVVTALAAAVGAVSMLADGPSVVVAQEKKKERREPDVIYVPTHMEVVEAMLELAKVTKDDVVYDLGCGDGRIPVTAHLKYGCKAMGFDIDPQRMRDSLQTVASKLHGDLVVNKSKAKGDTDWEINRIAVNNDKVVIENKDIFTLDLSKASVITLYLLPSLNVKLIPQLEKMKPGSRIVSHDFDMRGCKPDKVIRVPLKDGGEKTVYFWTIPFNKE